MTIETTEDLCNHIADLLGVYGCCKHAETNEQCEEKRLTCCRVGFMIEMQERMCEAVKNDETLNPTPRKQHPLARWAGKKLAMAEEIEENNPYNQGYIAALEDLIMQIEIKEL